MEGLDILGALDGLSKPKKGAVIGGGAGALVGALLATFTGYVYGKRIGRGFFRQQALLPFTQKLVPRAVKIAAGAAVVGAAGAGIGYGAGRAIEHRDAQAMLSAAKPGKPGAPGALPGKKAA